MDPYAMCYGGHQFGNWAGQLGDGRAINLGEVINHTGQRWAMQLKGAGPTPYSRSADGLAVLRSSVREFLCSEAMYHLGVPTTRALSLVVTGELVDYSIRNDFSHLGGSSGELAPATYVAWFEEVCRTTAKMIVHWLRVGFVHGVMNTDNMSILGLTIDYGPYGWLEDYDPKWTPNTTDAAGRRYCFGNQPEIAHWNLVQLANAIYPLIGQAAPLEEALNGYMKDFERSWQAMMAHKLGLTAFEPQTDEALTAELLAIFQLAETDMTIFYRQLALLDVRAEHVEAVSDAVLMEPVLDAYYIPEQLSPATITRIGKWLRGYAGRVRQDGMDETRRVRMHAVNPKYVLRNYLAQLAIDKAEQGDYSMVQELLQVLRHPYEEQAGREEYAKKRPDWARQRAGCSMLSCSS
jgi:uncharacterized protein YdiU (UPF0061 family)